MKKGFTLVELAVVLVIIGLLIGGILAAQSMSSATKITMQVRQLQQFDIAMTNFKTKFGNLPGDVSSFRCGSDAIGGWWGNNNGPGNGDGIINECSNIPSRWDPWCEVGNVWAQLSQTQMLQDNHTYISYFNTSNFNIYGGIQYPLAVISSNFGANTQNLGIIAYGIPATGKNYYDITTSVQNATYGMPSSVTPVDLLAIDTKIDDSIATAGFVTARNQNWLGMTDSSTAGAGNCRTASGSYNTSAATAKGINCVPRIEMFSQTGS